MLLNFSHRTSALSPLFKNVDPLVLDNSRPISLSYEVLILLYKVLTQIINDSLNPKCVKVVKINVHSSE
jgi:hypothetical protein